MIFVTLLQGILPQNTGNPRVENLEKATTKNRESPIFKEGEIYQAMANILLDCGGPGVRAISVLGGLLHGFSKTIHSQTL
jgi:hypothetical protein